MMEGGAREMTGRSRVDQPEGGARETTGGIWRRRSQERPRPLPRWWPMVEPTEGGAMVEEGPTDGGGAGGARGGDGELKIRGDTEDPEGQGRTDGTCDRGRGGDPESRSGVGAIEDRGGAGEGRSPAEPEVRSDEAQPEEWSPEAMAG
ncbi:hypothetical protein QQF64_009852 [Cirrhinus molitorella]|uniref:Uncharacterized protein n=1 Tax=Cirrhinus molitorella TaxID=172907 RepID=A0ABR3M363_9TELE